MDFIVPDSAGGAAIGALAELPEDTSCTGATTVTHTKAWRNRLLDWLTLLSQLKGAKAFRDAAALPPAVAPHLSSVEPKVQAAALATMAVLRAPQALAAYLPALKTLTEPKQVKTALTRFPLETGADGGIADADRKAILPVVLRLLLPLLRRRSGPGAGARTAVLNRLSALTSQELAPLLSLIFAPHAAVFPREAPLFLPQPPRLAAVAALPFEDTPWWVQALDDTDADVWLQVVTVDAMAALPHRHRQSLLNSTTDLLAHLGFRLQPYLPLLATLATRAFNAAEADRSQRTAALRSLCGIFRRFPDCCDWAPLWPHILPELTGLAASAAADSGGGGKVPAALSFARVLTASPHLLPVLADRQSVVNVPPQLALGEDSAVRNGVAEEGREDGSGDESMEEPLEDVEMAPVQAGKEDEQVVLERELRALQEVLGQCGEDWARQRCGSALVAAAVEAIAHPAASQAARREGLAVVETLAALPRPMAALLLQPHMPALLPALEAHLSARVPAAAPGRAVQLLHRVVPLADGTANTAALAAALAAAAAGRRCGDRRAAAALSALAVLWRRVPPSAADAGAAAAAALERLAPLAATLASREARIALSDAFVAAAPLVPQAAEAARVLSAVTKYSATALEEVDYDSRLTGYASLTTDAWPNLTPLSASVAMHACFADMHAADDLALRSAAASALTCMVDAAAASGTETLQQRVKGGLYRGLLRLAESVDSLPVRQEALQLLRRCGQQLPTAFPDLAALMHSEPEADFFLNVAHLQLHRRARAFQRLAITMQAAQRPASPDSAHDVAAAAAAAAPAADEAAVAATAAQPPLRLGLSLGTVQALVVPLIIAAVREGRSAAAGLGGHGEKKGAADKAQNVADAAVQALHVVASNLPWPQYQILLSRFLKACLRPLISTASRPIALSVYY